MHYQDKKHWNFLLLWILIIGLLVAGCVVDNNSFVISTVESNDVPLGTLISPTIAVTTSPTASLLPTDISTLHPALIVPTVPTMLVQEAEDALQELLKTNGNCTGKCLAGIYPDEMTIQEGVNQMAQWGMLYMSEDNTGVHLVPPTPRDKLIRINLDLILREQTIEGVSLYIPLRIDGEEFVDASIWQANREAWAAFRLDNLLKAYGTPSFVGFSIDSYDPEGEFLVYTLAIQYEEMNLKMGFGGLAQINGQDVFICPSSDSHNFGITINPQRPLSEVQQFSRITWQALTRGDLQTFYDTFTDESNSDGCFTTTISKIIELDPYFR